MGTRIDANERDITGMSSVNLTVRPLEDADRPWLAERTRAWWGGDHVECTDGMYEPVLLPGLVAIVDGEPVGAVTWSIADNQMQIITVNSEHEGVGIGTALLGSAVSLARGEKLRRVWLTTSNDNLHALGFYQKRGFVLAALHVNIMEQHRKRKPQIPMVSDNGIPIRDEIELEMLLG